MNENDAKWQQDWHVFVDLLEQNLQHVASTEELADCFGGCEVRWTGQIEQINIDELAAVVDVSLPERTVTLSDGSEVVLDGLALAVSEASTDKWQNLSVGDEVTFSATLGAPNSPFSPVELITLKGGTSIVMIRVCNAIPV